MYQNEHFPHHEETYRLIGIAMEIHRIIGQGFLEIVYKDALEYELKIKGIKYEREKKYSIKYKDTILPHSFFADFVIADKIILEIKSKSAVAEQDYAQVLNYLAISKLTIGLIVNFHEKSLQHRRIIFNK